MMRTVLPALAQAVVMNASLHERTVENLKEQLQVRFEFSVLYMKFPVEHWFSPIFEENLCDGDIFFFLAISYCPILLLIQSSCLLVPFSGHD